MWCLASTELDADEAVCGNNIAVCLALKRSGAVETSDLECFCNCRTLLHLAAGMGALDGLSWLLDQRVLDINAVTQDEEGLSVLQCAVLGGILPVVERVLAAGANAQYRFFSRCFVCLLLFQCCLAQASRPLPVVI
jgi:hypothetical protein